VAVGEVVDLYQIRECQPAPHLAGGDLNVSTQQHGQCKLRCVFAAPGMLMEDRNHRSVRHQHTDAGRVCGSQ